MCDMPCAICGNNLANEHYHIVTDHNSPICDDCFEDYVCCDSCGDYVHCTDSIGSDDGDIHCDTCYNDNFSRCYHCSGEIHNSDIVDYDGEGYCQSCFDECFCSCENCGNVYPIEDMHYNETNGDHRCEYCYTGENWDSGRDIVGHTFTELCSTRRYGIELEFSSCPDYGELEHKTCYGAKDDGTSGVEKEFVSPILQGDEGLRATRTFLHHANNRNFNVDSTCGYHLHIDCTNLSREQLRAICMAYNYTYSVWKYFVPEKRRNNHYCYDYTFDPDDIIHMDFDDLISLPESRYIWANWEAYKTHKTLEIRLHTGTGKEDKVINWVKAHLRFVDYVLGYTARELNKLFHYANGDELFEFMAEAWNDEKLTGYYLSRANKFGGYIHYEYENANSKNNICDILST